MIQCLIPVVCDCNNTATRSIVHVILPLKVKMFLLKEHLENPRKIQLLGPIQPVLLIILLCILYTFVSILQTSRAIWWFHIQWVDLDPERRRRQEQGHEQVQGHGSKVLQDIRQEVKSRILMQTLDL